MKLYGCDVMTVRECKKCGWYEKLVEGMDLYWEDNLDWCAYFESYVDKNNDDLGCNCRVYADMGV